MTDARTLSPRLPEAALLVDGRSVAPVEGGTVPVTNPATGETFFQAPAAGRPTSICGAGRPARLAVRPRAG
jgi:acyl-CoA reductase-like NAD-dependent aldehyde dehydrogenase